MRHWPQVGAPGAGRGQGWQPGSQGVLQSVLGSGSRVYWGRWPVGARSPVRGLKCQGKGDTCGHVTLAGVIMRPTLSTWEQKP